MWYRNPNNRKMETLKMRYDDILDKLKYSQTLNRRLELEVGNAAKRVAELSRKADESDILAKENYDLTQKNENLEAHVSALRKRLTASERCSDSLSEALALAKVQLAEEKQKKHTPPTKEEPKKKRGRPRGDNTLSNENDQLKLEILLLNGQVNELKLFLLSHLRPDMMSAFEKYRTEVVEVSCVPGTDKSKRRKTTSDSSDEVDLYCDESIEDILSDSSNDITDPMLPLSSFPIDTFLSQH